jgi:RAD51-like protein 2
MQLAVNAQIPAEFGGCAGGAIYIDTEGSFMVDRVEQIANGLIDHLRASAEDDENKLAVVSAMNAEQILSNIQYYRVYNYIEQCALINILPEYLKQQEVPVKVIVLDSVTFHFRYGFESSGVNSMRHRTSLLANLGQQLLKIAQEHGCAVIVMNQVTTKVETDQNTSYLTPALGQTWSHQATNKIYLEFDHTRRTQIRVSKMKDGKTGKRYYRVTDAGFRSSKRVEDDAPQEEQQEEIGEGGTDAVNEYNKRPRNSM